MAQKNSKSGGSSSRRGKSNSDASIQNMYEAIGVAGESAVAGAKARGAALAERFDMDEVMEKARNYVDKQIQSAKDYAREHPKAVLSGLAGIVIGAGALTAASMVKSRREASRKSAAKKSSASKSSSSKGGSKKSSSSGSSKKSSGSSKSGGSSSSKSSGSSKRSR
jgi:hypothetical protein